MYSERIESFYLNVLRCNWWYYSLGDEPEVETKTMLENNICEGKREEIGLGR